MQETNVVQSSIRAGDKSVGRRVRRNRVVHKELVIDRSVARLQSRPVLRIIIVGPDDLVAYFNVVQRIGVEPNARLANGHTPNRSSG